MTDFSAMIRAAARRTDVSGSTSEDMTASIRAVAGRGPAPQRHGEGNSEASAEQLQAARLAHLPDRFAHRLGGDDLGADARALAGVVEKFGGELVPGTSFDGGARGEQERGGGASMDDQIRRARDNRKMFGGVLPTDALSHLHTDR